MHYQKISVDLVVFSEDTKAVVSELNSAIDQLEKTHTIFAGEIETAAVDHSGTRRKSVLMHTLDAGNTVKAAIRLAAQEVSDAYRKVI